MSTASLSNEVLQMFGQFNKSYEESQASTGSIPRPPAGEWNCQVVDMKIELGQTVTNKQDGQKHPAFKAEFVYRNIGEMPPDWQASQMWPGKTFVLPVAGWNSIAGDDNKGTRSQIRIETGRFKGILKAILGDDFSGNIQADAQTAYARIKDKTKPVAVRVSCQYDIDQNDKTKKYFKEFGVRSLQ